MSSEPIKQVTGRGVYVPGDDIDTDRIIPARFMKCITFDGLGEYFFYDVRKDENGNDRAHNLNDERFKGSNIIVSGNNFGCGSSREHAPQAIMRAGFNAVIAGSFAEIFFGNSTTLGIPCVTAAAEDTRALGAAIEADPNSEVTIDVDALRVTCGELSFPVHMPDSARDALINAKWDPIGELMEGAGDVAERVKALGYA